VLEDAEDCFGRAEREVEGVLRDGGAEADEEDELEEGDGDEGLVGGGEARELENERRGAMARTSDESCFTTVRMLSDKSEGFFMLAYVKE
jgi:hypothetical protein